MGKFYYLSYILRMGLLCFFCLAQPGSATSAPEVEKQWRTIETRFTKIHYLSSADLHQFDRCINFTPIFPPLTPPTQTDSHSKLRTKIDAVYTRVQGILDMWKRFEKVKIFLHADGHQLAHTYREHHGQPCRFRAWYEYKSNTVHVNIKDLHERMLAHELAHAIIDHYLLIRPPRQTAEILARYVDSHLHPTLKKSKNN